jgi:large subunit ribosomal protein L13
MNQTTHLKLEDVNRAWHVTSAKGRVLGHVAVQVVNALMGKHNPSWTPTTDSGDYVIVTDVESLVVTGNKGKGKVYKFHSGWMGGLTELSFDTLHGKKPEQVLELAVKRMLPKTIQGSHQLKRLKVYKGAAHPHVSQQPKPL